MTAVDNYLRKVSEPQRSELMRIRAIVTGTVPEAEETISYSMPAFKYKGKYLIAYAPFKNHMSVFPGAGAVQTLQKKLTKFITSKGTIQFTIDNPLSEMLIKEIIKVRCREIDGK